MRHSKQVVELEFNADLPNSKSHPLYHTLELVGEREGGRKRVFQVKRMEMVTGKGVQHRWAKRKWYGDC